MRWTSRLVFSALGVFLCALPAAAQSHRVTVVKDLDYVPDVEYADGKDRLDLYIPQGVANGEYRPGAIGPEQRAFSLV